MSKSEKRGFPTRTKKIYHAASADMRRHSDTLRGAQRRRKRGSRGENRISEANSVVFPSYTKDFVFSRTCAGKRHLKSRERGDERGG